MRRFWMLLLTLGLLGSLAGCGAQTPPETPPVPETPEVPAPEAPAVPADPDEDCAVYDCGEIEIALPAKYLDQLIVDTDFPDAEDSWRPLMSVYERASVEAAEADWGDSMGFGFLFGFLAMDRAGYERLLCEDGSGIEVFAADGERYYAYTYPTDVQFYRSGGEISTESQDWRDWEALNDMGLTVRADVVERNGLTPHTGAEFLARPFTWEGSHVFLEYRPYYAVDGDQRIVYTLVLSQPAQQGEGGVWCVERWYDEYGNQYLWFPDSGMASEDYFARLQAECGAGEHPELRTSAGAAAAFVKEYFGHDTEEGSFAEADGLPEAYMERNSRLQETVLDLMAGREVDPMELLDRVGGASADNWGSLGRGMYGSDWFTPLMDAVEDAAMGTEQQRRDRAVLSFLLSAQGARTDFRTPLIAILRTQREADGGAFAAALAEFSPEERAYLKTVIGE